MVAGDYIHTTGDTHIYMNQLKPAQEWLSRKPSKLPKLVINRPRGTSLFDIQLEDLHLLDYDPQPFIKFAVAK